MTVVGWLEIALVLSGVLVAAWPLGGYMARVFAGERTLLSPLLAPIERELYAVARIRPATELAWLDYTFSMLALNGAGFVLLYALMRLQAELPCSVIFARRSCCSLSSQS